MLQSRLQDRHTYALGVAGRCLGTWADAYRPAHPLEPFKDEFRFMKLPAAFVPARGGAQQTNLYGDPFWHGLFDASYTRPGDYLCCATGVYFIASQLPLLPVLCVMTNRTISFARPNPQTMPSANPYGGYSPANATTLMMGWPASVVTTTHYGQPEGKLPTDQPVSYLTLLMPCIDPVKLETGDMLTDDLGRQAVLVAAELTELGWRLTAKVIAN
jgi:hypothetical protein